jgi:hypothetical protein
MIKPETKEPEEAKAYRKTRVSKAQELWTKGKGQSNVLG